MLLAGVRLAFFQIYRLSFLSRNRRKSNRRTALSLSLPSSFLSGVTCSISYTPFFFVLPCLSASSIENLPALLSFSPVSSQRQSSDCAAHSPLRHCLDLLRGRSNALFLHVGSWRHLPFLFCPVELYNEKPYRVDNPTLFLKSFGLFQTFQRGDSRSQFLPHFPEP